MCMSERQQSRAYQSLLYTENEVSDVLATQTDEALADVTQSARRCCFEGRTDYEPAPAAEYRQLMSYITRMYCLHGTRDLENPGHFPLK